MAIPNFYKINFEREFVFQGNDTAFLTIKKDPAYTGQKVWVYIWVQPETLNIDDTLENRNINSPYETDTQLKAINITNSIGAYPDGTTVISPSGGSGIGLSIAVTVESNEITKIIILDYGNLGYIPGDTIMFPATAIGGIIGPNIQFELANAKIYKYDADDNFYINGIKTTEFAFAKQSSSGVGAGYLLVANPLDGQTPGFYNRNGASTRWHKMEADLDEITYRVDYDGKDDAHLKIVLLFYLGDNPGTDIKTYLQLAHLAGGGPQSDYGVKDNHTDEPPPGFPTTDLSNFDYQEIHFFGYKESYVRPSREIYQNLYSTVENPLYDDKSSYALLRTNPKLTGNVKITVDSDGQLWLNSIDANDELSASKYKRFPISPKSTYQKDLSDFLSSMPSEVLYTLYEFDNQYLNTKRNLSEQYDNFYGYGVSQLKSKFYDENFSFFAPIWMRKKLPEYFVIFRLPHPLEEESYNELISSADKLSTFFSKADIVKTFDLRETSKLGSYLRKIVKDNRFVERPIEVSYEKDNPTIWNGIDYKQGALAGKSEFLYEFFKEDTPILDFEQYVTAGFERNSLLSANLINLEFLFDDEEVKLYSINRYLGFYVDENQLAQIEIAGLGIQKNTSQTPAPKPGVDAEPYSTRSFIQTNESGIHIPIHYYQGANRELGAEPEFTGTVTGKLPLPINVSDSLRMFYVKDRKGDFKRIKELKETSYGKLNTPDSITVTELVIGDKKEDISLYGGVNEIVSQFDAYLLDGSKAQLVLNLENTFNDPQCLLNEEEIEIVQTKLNEEIRDYKYIVKITNSLLGIVSSFEWIESGSGYQNKDVSYPVVGPAVVNLDSFLTIEFDPSINYLVNDEWEIIVKDSELTINNITGVESIVVKTTQRYEKFTWRMVANPIGLPTGGAFRYPVYDPNGYNSLSNFNPEGNIIDVAKSIADCINSFENRIVDAWAFENKVYVKSKMPFEDGNTIKIRRKLQGDSVFKNLTFYEKDIVNVETVVTEVSVPSLSIPTPPGQELNTSIIKYYDQTRYFSEHVYFSMSTNSLQVRLDVDPANPTLTGTGQLYSLTGLDSVDIYRAGELLFTIYTEKLSQLFSALDPYPTIQFLFRYDSNNQYVEQNLIGGVRRNRSRARVNIKDGKRFYKNGSSIANTSKITQQWFQVQKDKYSLLKGWEVQGMYLYSLPYLDEPTYDSRENINGYNRFQFYDIIQVESENDEFYQTRDKKIVAYSVYRPSVGIFTMYPIKMFDTDTIFSDYSYTQTPEVFRYFTKEKLIPKTAYDDIQANPITGSISTQYKSADSTSETMNYIKELDLFENWRLYGNLSSGPGDLILSLEAFDANSNEWVFLERITLRNFVDDDTFVFNTFFPVYFYNASEVPNDPSADLLISIPNGGPQYTMVGKRNYDKKTFNLERNIFTKARIILEDYVSVTTPVPPTITNVFITTIENNLYADDPDISSFNGFAGLQDFTTEQDEITIQQYRDENNPARFTYQLLLSEYDRLRENFTKEWAVKSKVVPYIQKWVQEGTDARDNYYRLNNSSAFGITNFSPDFEVNFIEPLLLTHEFPYLDAFPKNYPEESVENSRLYQFNKLSDRLLDYELNVLEDASSYFKVKKNIFFQDYKNDAYEKNNFYIEIEGRQSTIYNQQWEYLINVWKYVDLSDYKNTGIYSGSIVIDSTNNYVYEDKEFKIDLTSYQNSGYVLFSVQSSDPKTWYDVLKNDTNDDWFTKYFSVGCPTELLPVDLRIPKNREERYTFFNYFNGIGKSQSLFHGAKVQILDIEPETLVENTESRFYENYKFSAVARVVRKTNLVTDPLVEFDENGNAINLGADEPPFGIEVIKNEKYKTILMIITIRQNDYRLQSGGSEYTFFYSAVSELKSHMQSQGITSYSTFGPTSYPNIPANYPYKAFNMYSNGYYLKGNTTDFKQEPYTDTGLSLLNPITGSAEDYWYQISKLRNGFFGGSFLQLGDPKIRSIVNSIYDDPNIPDYDLVLKSSDIKPGYDIPLYDDMFPLENILPVYKTGFGTYGLFGNLFPTIQNSEYDAANTSLGYYKYGYYNRVYTTSFNLNGTDVTMYSITARPDLDATTTVLYNNIRFAQAYDIPNKTLSYISSRIIVPLSTVSPSGDGIRGYNYVPSSNQFPGSIGDCVPGETFHLYGGNRIIDSKKQEYSFANIAKLINTDDNILVTYYKISDNYVGETNDFKLRFVSFDRIDKVSKYYFRDDTDKPDEYIDVDNIGRDFVKTNEIETIFRHRGYYEPKSNEVVSFWVREDETFTSHFKKDYLLKNTRINNLSGISGIVRNLFYNKVSNREVLQISRSSSYKSLYPFIDEVSIDNGDQSVILSTWDDKYYRKYSSTKDYNLVPGIGDMKEFKSWLASKVMNTPKSYEFNTFSSNELMFEQISAGTEIGVSLLGTGGTNNQSLQDANKPKVIITLDLQARLLRQMKEDLLDPANEDEFLRLLSLSPEELNTLLPAQIDSLKTEYFVKNVIPLYEVSEVNLWSNQVTEGLALVDPSLSELSKVSLGYNIDKNCLTQSNNILQYTITKTLDTAKPQSFSVSILIKRI